MKHIAAYLLLQLGGNTSPSASDVKTLLEAVGVEADGDKLVKLVAELDGKDINEVSLDFFSRRLRVYFKSSPFCSSISSLEACGKKDIEACNCGTC